MSSITSALASTSLAVRLALGFGVFLAAYFLMLEPLIDSVSRKLSSCESKAALIATYSKTAQAMATAADVRREGVQKFGVVELPGEPEKRPLEFNQQVDAVLKQHDVRESTSTSRTAPMGNGPLSAKIGADFRADRMMRDIQFSASPDVAGAVLADLERLPVVSTISRLQIRTADGKEKDARQVRVTMTVETWLQARKGKK